jgi:hypothetical protein
MDGVLSVWDLVHKHSEPSLQVRTACHAFMESA